MKISICLLAVALCAGCSSTGTNPSLTPALVEIAVQTGAAFGIEKYPQSVPALRVATPVVCSAANGTNVEPAQIVAALQNAGIGTNAEAMIVMDGAIALYDTIFASYGSSWTANQPTLVLYLKAVCDGLNAAIPPQGPAARKQSKPLPPHL